MTRLLLLRHGRTRANAEKRFQGRLDLPLDEVGLSQAERAREALSGVEIDRCLCSPLKRAGQTAEIALKGRMQPEGPIPLILDDRLSEFALGEWEGWPSDKVREAVSPSLKHWTEIHPLEFRPPGGETIPQVLERVEKVLEELRAGADGSTVLIVSHQVVLSLIRMTLNGLSIDGLWGIKQDPGAVIELSLTQGAKR